MIKLLMYSPFYMFSSLSLRLTPLIVIQCIRDHLQIPERYFAIPINTFPSIKPDTMYNVFPPLNRLIISERRKRHV